MKSKYIIFLLALSFLFGLNSCKNTDLNLSEGNYLVFGHFHGECMGEGCVEIYRLENGRIMEDTKDIYPNANSFYQAKYILLDSTKFNKTKDLVASFPKDLLNEKNNVIGQPDAGDWGGLYIEYNFDGIHKMWLLDKMKTNVPVKYHQFIDILNDKISTLK